MRILIAVCSIIFVCICTVAAQQPVEVKFSVYVVPGEREHLNESFERIDEINYAYGEQSIPLQLKEARQSIAYPYRGPAELVFFIKGTNAKGEPVNIPVCTTTVSSGAKKGILLLRPKKGQPKAQGPAYEVMARWFRADELKGGGELVNLTREPLVIKISTEKKPLMLKPQGRTKLKASFDDDSGCGFVDLECYNVIKGKGDATSYRKAFVKSLILEKDSSMLVVLLASADKSLKTLSLNADGVPNKRSLKALRKYLPDYGRKKNAPVPEDGTVGLNP